MTAPNSITLGQTDLASRAFTRLRPTAPRGSHFVVDMMGFQFLDDREYFGERGISTGGGYPDDGPWSVRVGNDPPTIDLPAFRTYITNLSPDITWLGLNIENIPWSRWYPTSTNVKDDLVAIKRSHDTIRLLHAEARLIRPDDLWFCPYVEEACLPHRFAPAGFPQWDLHLEDFNSANNLLYRERCKQLGVGKSGNTTFSTRGVNDSADVIASVHYLYLDLTETREEIQLRCIWLGKTLRDVRENSKQPIGCYVSPMGATFANEVGAIWNDPLDPGLAAYHGYCLREAGIDAIVEWGYQSDISGRTLPFGGGATSGQRVTERARIFDEDWRPTMEAYAYAFKGT